MSEKLDKLRADLARARERTTASSCWNGASRRQRK